MVFLTPELKVFNHWDGSLRCFGSLLLMPQFLPTSFCPRNPSEPRPLDAISLPIRWESGVPWSPASRILREQEGGGPGRPGDPQKWSQELVLGSPDVQSREAVGTWASKEEET